LAGGFLSGAASTPRRRTRYNRTNCRSNHTLDRYRQRRAAQFRDDQAIAVDAACGLRGDMSGEIIVINRATRDFPPHSYWLEDHGKSSRLQLQRIDM